MTIICYLAVAAAILVTPAISWAGDFSGTTTRSDAFFAEVGTDYIRFDTQEKMMQLAKLCNEKKPRLHAFKDKRKYRCESLNFSRDENGNVMGNSASIEISSTIKNDTYFNQKLFSLRPFSHATWEIRPLNEAEQSQLLAYLSHEGARHQLAINSSRIRKAVVVSKPAGHYQTILVPGKHVQDPDSYIDETSQYIFLLKDKTLRYQGQLPDKAKDFIDLDGSDIPMILTDVSVDGVSIELWDIRARPKQVMSWGGH